MECLVDGCDKEATWSFGTLGDLRLVYCDKHIYWGQYVVIHLKDSLRTDKRKGSSLTGKKKQPTANDIEATKDWLHTYWGREVEENNKSEEKVKEVMK